MKIEIEKLMLAIFLILIVSLSLYLISPVSDDYYHFFYAKELYKDPNFLFTTIILRLKGC